MAFPPSIKNLIDQFSALPGIGPKTAERLVYYLLKKQKSDLAQFGEALEHIKDKITVCQKCYNFAESNPCEICGDKKRSQTTICIVEKPQDLYALEKTGEYNGTYHVLGGVIDALEGITPEKLKIRELGQRIKQENVKEVILAMNSDLPGETTILYLLKFLKQFPQLKVSRLAQGLPTGSDLEYADEITLTNALKGRREL